MPVVIVDGKEIEIGAQERLNGIQVAKRAGADVPHYCWHPGLSVVASCRMITVAACEAGIAMALILMLAQRTGKLDAVIWQDLREEGQPAYVDQQVPEELAEDQVWPTLTPAGREPAPNVEEQTHRSRV